MRGQYGAAHFVVNAAGPGDIVTVSTRASALSAR
jgi:hypothetical protein